MRMLRRLPLPVFAIILGLIVGISAWLVVDPLQTRSVMQLFESELNEQLESQARESLVRFNHFVRQYSSVARLLANHRVLAQHLSPLFWRGDDLFYIQRYKFEIPDWLPSELAWQALPKPTGMLLVDRFGKVREEYQSGEKAIPVELVEYTVWEPGISKTIMLEIAGKPYLLLIEQIEDEADNVMGALVIIVAIDTEFLFASQQGIFRDNSMVALLQANDHRILVSSRSSEVFEQFLSEQLQDQFVVTAQALSNFSDSFNLLFATFIPRSSTESTINRVLEIERQQRWIGAVVFIVIFSLLIAYISLRLNRVLKRISDFARRALGMSELKVRPGNRLFVLEEWIRDFSELVLAARDEMRVRHEDEIRETEALKAAIMDTSLDSIITVDETGKIIDFNPTAEKIFGYQAKFAIGQFIEPLIISKLSRQDFWNSLHDCLSLEDRPESQLRTEIIAMRHDGSTLPVEIAIKPLLLKDHFLFTVYLHDMSMRKQQEQEIRNLAAFPSESPMPVLRVNQRGVIIYANPPSKPLLDYWGVGFLQTMPVYWHMQIERVLTENIEKDYEVSDGQRFYSLLLVPIREGNYVNIYGKDVTETRKAEAESRQHQTELVQVCRLSTMGEMAAGIAHELNQPLSAITNFARGSMRRLKNNPEDTLPIVEALDKIASQAHRASEIIKRMRGMLANQPAIRDQGDLNQLVTEVVSFVEFEARREAIEFDMQLADMSMPILVDFVQIEQVVLNIVKNAMDVLVEFVAEERKIVIETGYAEDGRLFIAISDNGPGMNEETRNKLFHPFYTTKDSGMGMGLAISQTIIEDHKGHISVASQPGRGTCFTVYLPASEDKLMQISGY